MKIAVYDMSGKKLKDLGVSKNIFDVSFNEGLVHQALVRQQANARKSIAKAKTRGEVRGGGRKPWRQKGTGRARTGSIRNPIWRGGGITFGPTGQENYSKSMPKKQRRLALCSALSEKLRHNQVIALDKYTHQDIKTKYIVDLIEKLPVDRSVLLVVSEKNDVIQKSAQNIPHVHVILASYLNISDILKYKYVVFLEDAIKKTEETFSI